MDDSCTAGGIQFRFRRIKQGAALLKDAVDKGINPSTIPFGDGDGGEMIFFYFLSILSSPVHRVPDHIRNRDIHGEEVHRRKLGASLQKDQKRQCLDEGRCCSGHRSYHHTNW